MDNLNKDTWCFIRTSSTKLETITWELLWKEITSSTQVSGSRELYGDIKLSSPKAVVCFGYLKG